VAAQPSVHDECPSVEWSEPCPATGSAHVPVVGYLRGPAPRGVPCDQPLSVMCGGTRRATASRPRRVIAGCGAQTVWACSGHRSSKCGPCAGRYKRRLSRIAEEGLRLRDGRGFAYMITLTAPGRSEHAMPSGDVCPCTPEGGVELEEWNPTCAARWNRVRGALKRLRPELDYLGSVEVQKRGALHRHVIVWVADPLTVQQVRPLAIAAGFGHEVDVAEAEPGSRRFAYYVSKYVTKSCDQREQVPWRADVADEQSGEVRSMNTDATFRTWSQSRGWGMTMREVRMIARVAAAASAERLRGQSPRDEDPWSEPVSSILAEPPD
jgi:hypothetical protein